MGKHRKEKNTLGFFVGVGQGTPKTFMGCSREVYIFMEQHNFGYGVTTCPSILVTCLT